MVLGRMIYYYIPSRSLFSVPAPVIGAAFVSLDIVSFAIQLVGGSLAGPSAPAADQLRAIHIYMGGIGLQEFFIVVFVLLAIRFHWEMNALHNTPTAVVIPRRGWKPLLVTLYVSLGLITVCNPTSQPLWVESRELTPRRPVSSSASSNSRAAAMCPTLY